MARLSPGGVADTPAPSLSPLRGCGYERGRAGQSHGLRRGLLSGAAPRLSQPSHLRLMPMQLAPWATRSPAAPDLSFTEPLTHNTGRT